MESVVVKAYAKINLFLEVCEKRIDNYHNIDSVMHTVSLHDIITVTKSDKLELSNNIGLPNDSSNLAYKAALKFFEYFSINSGCKIHIEKNIPVSAGLAGGSTDAAAVLKALNQLYDIGASVDTLCEIGAKLGADVPFCIKGGCCITKGIGDIMTPCQTLPGCYIVVSKMGEGVSTPYAYGQIDELRSNTPHTPLTSDTVVSALKQKDLDQLCKYFYNAFEQVVIPIRPLVSEQKEIMLKNGAVASMMSGSGPSVFGIYTNKDSAETTADVLRSMGAQAYVCTSYT